MPTGRDHLNSVGGRLAIGLTMIGRARNPFYCITWMDAGGFSVQFLSSPSITAVMYEGAVVQSRVVATLKIGPAAAVDQQGIIGRHSTTEDPEEPTPGKVSQFHLS